MQLLANTHISPETAYVVEDYPYGFRLRCKIRYWLDCSPKRGARLMSQTTNPKIAGREVWNKPKASTYCRFGGAMYLDDEGHVQWNGLTEYSDGKTAAGFRDVYGPAVPQSMQTIMNAWVAAKIAYDAKSAETGAMSKEAAAAGRVAFVEAIKENR